MVMTTNGAGYGLVPPHLQEVEDMSKEAELMASYKVKIVKPVHVRGEVAKIGQTIEGLTRAERDTLVHGEMAVDATPEKTDAKPKSK
jgi:hypothetical protein